VSKDVIDLAKSFITEYDDLIFGEIGTKLLEAGMLGNIQKSNPLTAADDFSNTMEMFDALFRAFALSVGSHQATVCLGYKYKELCEIIIAVEILQGEREPLPRVPA
jgi:hypothetical protein